MAQDRTEKQKSIVKAKTIVFRQLKYRPRSVYEIQEKLRGKDFSDEIIEQAIDYFKRIGSINDAQFALGWTRSRLNKPFGLRRIRMELKHKGVNNELIDSALSQCMQDYEETKTVLLLAKQRMPKYAHLDKQTARRRLYGYLARRGFNNGAIVKAIHKL